MSRKEFLKGTVSSFQFGSFDLSYLDSYTLLAGIGSKTKADGKLLAGKTTLVDLASINICRRYLDIYQL